MNEEGSDHKWKAIAVFIWAIAYHKEQKWKKGPRVSQEALLGCSVRVKHTEEICLAAGVTAKEVWKIKEMWYA